MVHTSHVFLESEDRSAAETYLAAKADQQVYTSGDNLRLKAGLNNLALAYVISNSATYQPVKCRLSSASLSNLPYRFERGIGLNYLAESAIYDFRDFTLPLPINEDITAYGYEEDEAGVAHYLGLVLVVTDQGRIPRGPLTVPNMKTVTGAAATACTANTWTTSALTFDDTLPTGLYRLWGARILGTQLVSSRFVLKDYVVRPSVIPVQDVDENVHGFSLNWGMPYTFKAPENNPQLETLSCTTDTPDFELYLQRVG